MRILQLVSSNRLPPPLGHRFPLSFPQPTNSAGKMRELIAPTFARSLFRLTLHHIELERDAKGRPFTQSVSDQCQRQSASELHTGK